MGDSCLKYAEILKKKKKKTAQSCGFDHHSMMVAIFLVPPFVKAFTNAALCFRMKNSLMSRVFTIFSE